MGPVLSSPSGQRPHRPTARYGLLSQGVAPWHCPLFPGQRLKNRHLQAHSTMVPCCHVRDNHHRRVRVCVVSPACVCVCVTHVSFEPYVILDRATYPPYDERFRGYGYVMKRLSMAQRHTYTRTHRERGRDTYKGRERDTAKES